MTMKQELDTFRDELEAAGRIEEYIEATELLALHEVIRLTPEYFEKVLNGDEF